MLDRQPAQAVDFAADPAGSAWLKLDIGGHLLSASGTAARLFGHNDNDALVDARPDVNDLFADHSFFETIATRADPPKVLWLARRSDDELFVVTVCLTQRDASWYCILEPYIEAQQLHRALHEERARFAVLADISSNGIFMS
ncbi:MAG TPA: hypothetical protein VF254_00160, partial [Gammaproteobacteria bacterium]